MESLTVRSKRDIIDFVNSHDNPNRSKTMVYIALGGIFIDAYDFTSLGIGVDSLQAQLALSAFELGSVTAIMAFGALLGAFGGGYLTDRLGRFKTFILDLILLVVAAIGTADRFPHIGSTPFHRLGLFTEPSLSLEEVLTSDSLRRFLDAF
jgi:MFS transporter, putative metabolite transport protein